jgi:beta-lactam-binding protein with PASTA domain
MQAAHRLAVAALAACSTLASASVFYKFDVVAESGQGGIVNLGTGPSINNAGDVAYVGRFTSSTIASASIFVRPPTGPASDLASSMVSPNRNFGEAVRINEHKEVAAWTRVLSGTLQLFEVRIFRATSPGDSSVLVRGAGSSSGVPAPYEILYQNPALNAARVLEDRAGGLPGDKDGVCDAGEVCMSQIAFTAVRAVPSRFVGTVVHNPQNAFDLGVQNESGFTGQTAKPAMADDGRIAIRGNSPSNPILLYDHDVGSSVTIAGSAQGFTTLGNAPGITPDGKIVAFAGNRGQGDGIFLSQQLPGGQRRVVRLAGENLLVQKAELGFSATNAKRYFSSIELDSRVGIIYTPGQDGTVNGAVVVTFIGTPNGASRTNAGTGKPYLFSGQKGLWMMRIELAAPLFEDVCAVRAPGVMGNPFTLGGDDEVQVEDGVAFVNSGDNKICESGNTHDVETLFARAGPIPVVQVGDNIGANVVANVAVHDPIAPAKFDSSGAARTERIGDHRVAFWADVGGGNQLIVRGEHLDSDQDGLMDHWETTGLDLDGTGTIDLDLAAMGATPFQRDFFVQIDFAADRPSPLNLGEKHRPIPGVIRRLSQFYAGAPAMPSGVLAGVRLHLDAGTGRDRAGQNMSRNMGAGPLQGGKLVSAQPIDIMHYGLPNSVTLTGVNAADFDTVKQNNLRNSHRGAREFVFTHVLWTDFHHGLDQFGGSNNTNPVTGTATSGDSWTLYDNNNPNIGAGNFGHGILITGGTGAGQMRQIASSGANSITVSDAFNVVPDATSTYILLHGSGGESQPGDRYDGAFAPGKNFSLTLGGFGRDPVGKEQGRFIDQWQTLAHEIGHNQTLMHGGNNHGNHKANYVSLMNYAYQLCTSGVGKDRFGNPLTGGAPCPVNSYAGPTDAVRNDWGTLDFASSLNPTRTGQAFSAALDPNNVPYPPPPEPSRTLRDILIQHGPQDGTVPVAAVTAPASGSAVAVGSGIAVSFTATDNVGVTRAEVLFDVNGNGEIDEPSEVFAATPSGGGSFTANVPAVSGPSGTRSLTVYAFDAVENPGTAYVRINVGSVAALLVPNVVGAAEEAARNTLLAANFEPGAITRQQSASVPAGSVISQNPAAGQSRAPGTPVALVISLGSNGAFVPNVQGLSQSAASTAITAAGFAVGAITQASGAPLPPNTVIGQSPPGGQIAASGSAVLLLVAAGAGVTVPNVVGLTQAAATNAITGAGLVVGTVTQQTSMSVPAGNVISQNPTSGTVVAGGSAVNLVVSIGPPSVTVPNVVGQTQAAATTAITSAGLVVGTVTQKTSLTVPAGSVISQVPAAGTSVPSGSAIALVVSLGLPCSEFDDVAATSGFCANVEWLKNREITLGCNATSYCPGSAVIRLAMAAFMNRLGDALTAVTFAIEQASLAFDPATAQIVCATGEHDVAGFPRRAHVDAVARFLSSGNTGIVVEPVASTDGGATWVGLAAQTHRGSALAGRWSSLRALAHRDLAVDETIRFALRVSRGGLPGTGVIADGSCNLRVRIDNRNGGSSPFDPE